MFILENALPEAEDRAKLRLAKQIYGRVHGQYAPSTDRASPSILRATIDHEQEGLLRVGAWHLGFAGWGGRRDSNPQQPEPQSGALPLSYDHRLEP